MQAEIHGIQYQPPSLEKSFYLLQTKHFFDRVAANVRVVNTDLRVHSHVFILSCTM